MKLFNFFSKFKSEKATQCERVKPVCAIPVHKNVKEICVPEIQDNQPVFLSACKDFPTSNSYVAYYKDGVLYNVNPRNENISLDEDRGIAYEARYIISDNIKYDLESADSITNIAVPKFGSSYATRDLSYILKMRAIKENRPKLAIPLCYKVANLMVASPIAWGKKDYYRLVIQLWSIGAIEYGDFLLEELKKCIPTIMSDNAISEMYSNSFVTALEYAKEINSDYLHVPYTGSVCATCATYQNRVYSISGNDRRFPKLPDFIIQDKGRHCSLSVYAFNYYEGCTLSQYICENSDSYQCVEVDAIEYSNRPFVDDRSEYEKQCYEQRIEKIEKTKKSDAQYYSRRHWIEQYREQFEYQQLVDLLGEKAPKNFSSYKRIKKNQTSTFYKLADVAKENGITITT